MKVVPKIICCLVFLFIVAGSSLRAQNVQDPADSLKQLLSAAKTERSVGHLCALIADEIMTNDLPQAIMYADSALKIGRKLQDTVLTIEGLNVKGRTLLSGDHYNESLLQYTEALRLAQLIGNDKLMASCYLHIGWYYQRQGNQYDREIMYYRKAMEICEQYRNLDLARCYLSLSQVFSYTEDYDSVRYYVLKAVDIAADSSDQSLLSSAYNNLGGYYSGQNDFENAIRYFEKGKAIKEMRGDKRGLVISHLNIGQSYVSLEKYESAIEQFDSALVIATALGNKYLLKETYSALSNVHKKAGDYKSAYEVFQKYLLYRDSIYDDEKSSELLKLQEQFESVQKERENALLKNTNEVQAESIRRKDMLNYAVIIGLLLAIGAGIYIFYAYRQKKKANKEISRQKAELEIRNQEVFDSITYAKRIQYTLLANRELLQTYLSEHFVYFKPKDIVSGDFYWAAVNSDGDFYLAVCDSTGHGVPGAFMSLLNISFLNEAISEKKIKAPGEILDHARMRLIDSVSKEGAQDGMDGTLLRFSAGKIHYAAANNNPVLVRNGQITELSADKMPVGAGSDKQFSTHTLECVKGDAVFILTDGYADQFGGPKGKKFKYKQLYQLFEKNASCSMPDIQQMLTQAHEQWCGDLEQVDDICIIGFRI